MPDPFLRRLLAVAPCHSIVQGQHSWVEGGLAGLDLDRRPVVRGLDGVVQRLEPEPERLDLRDPVGHGELGHVRDLLGATDVAAEGLVPVVGRLVLGAVAQLQAREERHVPLELLQAADRLGEGHLATFGVDPGLRVGDGDRRLEPDELVLGLAARRTLDLEAELGLLAGLVRDGVGGAALVLLQGALELLHAAQRLRDRAGDDGRDGGNGRRRNVHGLTSDGAGKFPRSSRSAMHYR